MNKLFTKRSIINTGKSFMDYYLSINNREFKSLLNKCIDNSYNYTNISVSNPIRQSLNISLHSYNHITYDYANTSITSQPITYNLYELSDYINQMFNSDFNCILLSKYNNGLDYIGKQVCTDLSKNGIVILSYGRREFKVHNIRNNRLVAHIETKDYSLIHTYGDYHINYVNEIVKNIKLNTTAYTFTFCKKGS